MTRLRLVIIVPVLAVIIGCATARVAREPDQRHPTTAEAVAIAADAYPDAPPPCVTVAGLSGNITSIGASTTRGASATSATSATDAKATVLDG